MLMGVFGKDFPEGRRFDVDREAVHRYKLLVRNNLEKMQRYLRGLCSS